MILLRIDRSSYRDSRRKPISSWNYAQLYRFIKARLSDLLVTSSSDKPALLVGYNQREPEALELNPCPPRRNYLGITVEGSHEDGEGKRIATEA